MKEFLIKDLMELITHHIDMLWDDLCFNYINSKWDYVELYSSDVYDISYRKYISPLSYLYEDNFDWWEIIFQLDSDFSWIDKEEIEDYRSDYEDLLKDKDKYIKDKVDYIISLTW